MMQENFVYVHISVLTELCYMTGTYATGATRIHLIPGYNYCSKYFSVRYNLSIYLSVCLFVYQSVKP
jgi:hypothetical protein